MTKKFNIFSMKSLLFFIEFVEQFVCFPYATYSSLFCILNTVTTYVCQVSSLPKPGCFIIPCLVLNPTFLLVIV